VAAPVEEIRPVLAAGVVRLSQFTVLLLIALADAVLMYQIGSWIVADHWPAVSIRSIGVWLTAGGVAVSNPLFRYAADAPLVLVCVLVALLIGYIMVAIERKVA
jgi:hypothetical protein